MRNDKEDLKARLIKIQEAKLKKTRPYFQNQLTALNLQNHKNSTTKIVSRNIRPSKPIKQLKEVATRNHNLKLLIDTPNLGLKNSIEYPTPKWFRYSEKADVSVIIPLYKSKSVIVDLINSWVLDNENLKVEIIFVDDKCPNNSKDEVIKTWTKKSSQLNGEKIGKVIYNNHNLGYGGACNIGANYATGDYLIFLNADTTVTSGWIVPIVNALKDLTIGIVGNLHLKEGGIWNGTIDSAGSEWSWDSMSFGHIGRHVYKDQNLPNPYLPKAAPNDIMTFGERDMVTGCCFGIRKQLFKELGGFNSNYRIGYWEDSEICMCVKEKGLRIVFEPKSVICHKLGHTNSGAHEFQNFNREYFANKWIKTGRIDALIHNPRSTLPNIGTILIQRRGAHGDVLTAASVCPALKKKYPGCKILFSTHCPEVLKGNPYIDKIVTQEEISERSFHVFFNLDMVYEYRPYTNIIEAYADDVGVSVDDCKNYLQSNDSWQELRPTITIHAGKTQWVGRDWTQENFAIIAQRLLDLNYVVVCVGKGGDQKIPCTFDNRNSLTIAETASIIKASKLFIGIDSFPMHIAQTFDTPGICFFGSINPESRIYSKNMQAFTATNLNCLGCHHRKPAPCTVTNNCETGTFDCINQASVEQMWQKILKLLERNFR